MRKIKFFITLIIVFIGVNNFAAVNNSTSKKIKILLIGDSTTEQGKPVFENSVEQLLAGVDNMPPVEVVNVGRGGETAYSLLNSGRYDKDIKGIDSVDYIFLRYGINDWSKRKPFKENFLVDMSKLIAHLKIDFPSAEIIVMTIIPFLNKEDSKVVNDLISKVAADEKLELFDIYPAYQKRIEEYGLYSMNIRFYPLSDIPKNYHKLVAPYTSYVEWKGTEMVTVKSNELDPLLGHLPKWYNDNHPNTTGYRLIAGETVKFILPKLKSKLSNN